jgi:hypothetical protein
MSLEVSMRDSTQHSPHASPTAQAPDLRRRRFLLAVSAGGAGAVAAAAPARAAVAAAPADASPADGAPGYRESAHVKRYYDTTRI